MVPSNGWLQREHDTASSFVSAPHSLQYAALLGVRARWAIRTFYEDRGIPDGSLVRVVREDLREMFPARRGLVRLRDAQGRQPHDPDILRDFQEGFHLLLVEGEDPGGPQPLTRCRDGDVRERAAQVQRYQVMYPPIIPTASSRPAPGTTTKGAAAMGLAVLEAAGDFPLVSSSETTMNFH